MAKNSYKSNSYKQKTKSKKFRIRLVPLFVSDRRFHVSVGFFTLIASFFLFISFFSYLFTGKADQSVLQSMQETPLSESGLEIENWFGLVGAWIAHLFMFRWIGLSSFLVPPLLFVIAYKILFRKQLVALKPSLNFSAFFIVWLSTLLGYLTLNPESPKAFSYLAGGVGFEIAFLLHSLLGWGTFLLLILSLLVFVVYFFNVQLQQKDKVGEDEKAKADVITPVSDEELIEKEKWGLNIEDDEEIDDELEITQRFQSDDLELTIEDAFDKKMPSRLNGDDAPLEIIGANVAKSEKEPEFDIEDTSNAEVEVSKLENYDPTLDLSSFRFPTMDLLHEHGKDQVRVTQEELEENKDKILETLHNFKIGISKIKATIGPTVTLYEIVPEAGIKISKIKNLEDDIALSLSALGIRIIAPIPGKGTIGIEVPNKNRETVSMRSVISTEKFVNTKYDLPVILGKTISNEVYMTDLTKMPHLLMAGATGQGKSVGLNVLLTSLLYKKHPSQLKLVLVDPKRVELTLYNKIENHYLAKLPDNEEAIITDTKKVVYTLNSLCIEMENRLELLKDAGCRNLKEYNKKFVERRLNPEHGHRYMPYIVLVIDELADLMTTAGKEVETPISRLAAVARAIGIHLVLATQRPSVNVITGVIKANFPARMSYKVTSKIDSRTILDMGGADQLVGMGDMLFSLGSELVRLQCPFIDTAEVDDICRYIGDQRGYASAYMLPEFVGDESPGAQVADLNDRDAMFDEAARLVVLHQQGSTSLIQRKLKLGYNRAGRIMDQLEAAGIVGQNEGSKAREVLVGDEYALEQLLNDIASNN